MIQKILVPVDGSEHSTKAMMFAAECATKFGASILLLHVLTKLPARAQLVDYLQTLESAAEPNEIEIESIRGALLNSGEEEGRALLMEAQRTVEAAGVTAVTTALADGDPAREIIARIEAGNYDVLVMGRRGLGGLKGLVLGSVSHRVLHAAECTVVTVK